MRKLILVVSMPLIILGCGGGINSCSDFYDQFLIAYCQKAVLCGAIGQSEEQKCEADARAGKKFYFVMGASPDDAVAMKRMAFDSSAASLCLDSFRRSECSNVHFDPVSCNRLFVGLVANGSPCQSSSECGSGICFGGAQGCFGTCQAFLPTGADCSMAGTSCNTKSDTCDPSTKKCVTRPSSGQACTAFAPCQDGLFCKGGVCGGASNAGDPCATSGNLLGGNSCAPGLYCDSSTANATCKARVAAGGACPVSTACLDSLVCASGKCTVVLDIGATCDPIANACPSDAKCDGSTLKCTVMPVGAVGSACSIATPCRNSQELLQPPLYCDSMSKTCVENIQVGGVCTVPAMGQMDACQAGSVCDPGTKICTIKCK